MIIAIFDIDGTLTDSYDADTRCYEAALAEAWGLEGFDLDWHDYTSSTDAGVAVEIHTARFGEPPSAERAQALEDAFGRIWARDHADRSRPIDGAPALLAEVMAAPDFAVGIATGCWQSSAEMKLDGAGYPVDRLDLSTATHHPQRPDIVRRAIERQRARVGDARRVVYVGDGVWDIRAAKALGIEFVGVGAGERAERLAAEGATFIVDQLGNVDGLVRHLRR